MLFYHPFLRGVLSIWMLIVCLALVYVCVRLLLQKRAAAFLLSLVLFAGFDIYRQNLSAYIYFTGDNAPSYRIDTCPVWLAACVNLLLTVVAAVLVVRITAWQRSHISAVSIKESFDRLTAGVCFYDESGRVYQVNERMDRIAQTLTGTHLFSGVCFWQTLQNAAAKAGNEDRVLLPCADRMLSFTRYHNQIGKQRLFEIVATDVTQEWEQNRLLSKQNAELQELNRQLEAYHSSLDAVVREKELLRSKARLHDEMNILLISTLQNAETCDETQTERLLVRWQDLFKLTATPETDREKAPETLEALAKALGMTLCFSGTFPKEKAQARLLVAAVSECMTNALRHANATTLTVRSDQHGAVITNDGTPPQGEITEGGGLGNLRELAQKTPARITVCSRPAFSLTLTYEGDDPT